VAILSHEPNTVHGDITDASEADFDSVYTNYVTTPFLTCQSALPLLEKSTTGPSVILFTSIAGYTPFVDVGLFSAAKTAQLGLCKALAQSLARRRIRVNSVCLGMFVDDGSSAAWTKCSPTRKRSAEEVEATQRQLGQLIPAGRVAGSDDCAGLVAFLASEASCYITGENVVLSGGVSVRI
jgi:dehydrogenase/reductase SDR family protein 4